MKKKRVQYRPSPCLPLGQQLQEPEMDYGTDTSVFAAGGFEHLQQQLGFSQVEWAAILHISDRTLQRYLKDGRPFTGLQAELLHYLQKLTRTGLQVFESAAAFEAWLRGAASDAAITSRFQLLQSITGIRLLQQELGRIAYGVHL